MPVKENFSKAEKLLKEGVLDVNIRNQVWLLLFDNEKYYWNIYKKRMRDEGFNDGQIDQGKFLDCFNELILKVIKNFQYDSSSDKKNQLERYFNRNWKYRVQDSIKEQKIEEPYISLDEENDEENNKRKIEIIIEDDLDFDKEADLAEVLVEILNAINHLVDHKMGTKIQENYYRMFFTDYITEYCKNCIISKRIQSKEHTIIAGLDIKFMDFYMKACCRSFWKIRITPLKSMKEISKEGSDDEIKLPLQGIIYCIYLNLKSSGNITQMRTKYKKLCEGLNIKNKLI